MFEINAKKFENFQTLNLICFTNEKWLSWPHWHIVEILQGSDAIQVVFSAEVTLVDL